MTPDSDNIRFMRIFAAGGSQDVCNFSLDFVPAPAYYVYTYLALFSLSSSMFIYYSYLPMAAAASCKVRASGDVASGLVKCDPQSIWNPRKNLRIFRRRYIVGILTNANISI